MFAISNYFKLCYELNVIFHLQAIVFALKKVHQYANKRAWERFEKGVYWTKADYQKGHEEMIQSIENTSAEELERHKRNIEEKTKKFF